MLSAYPTLEQSILIVRDWSQFLPAGARVQLTRINSGSTRATNHRDCRVSSCV